MNTKRELEREKLLAKKRQMEEEKEIAKQEAVKKFDQKKQEAVKKVEEKFDQKISEVDQQLLKYQDIEDKKQKKVEKAVLVSTTSSVAVEAIQADQCSTSLIAEPTEGTNFSHLPDLVRKELCDLENRFQFEPVYSSDSDTFAINCATKNHRAPLIRLLVQNSYPYLVTAEAVEQYNEMFQYFLQEFYKKKLSVTGTLDLWENAVVQYNVHKNY